MQTFFRLKVEGRSVGRISTDIREIAGDAVDMGFAWPDLEGRIVLGDQADIETLAVVKCSNAPCKCELHCAMRGQCGLNNSSNNH